MREHIATIQKCNVLKSNFSSEGLIYSSSAYVRNMHETMTIVIGKLNFASYQSKKEGKDQESKQSICLFLDVFSP